MRSPSPLTPSLELARAFDAIASSPDSAARLLALRRRLQRHLPPNRLDADEHASACRIAALKRVFHQTMHSVTCCSTCAVRHPFPHGRWSGGHCCGTDTNNVFTEQELACMRAAGSTVWSWPTSAREVAGCIFRGPVGCLLPPQHRPVICVAFTCAQLTEELVRDGQWPRVERIQRTLRSEFDRFCGLRANRVEREAVDAMERELLSWRYWIRRRGSGSR